MSEKNDILISPADTVTIPIEEYRSLVKKGTLLVAKYAKRVLDTETLQMALFGFRAKDRSTTDQEQGEKADA